MVAVISGGCGFIGSNFVDFLVKMLKDNDKIYVIDNLSTGKIEYLNTDSRVTLIKSDISDTVSMNDIIGQLEPDYIWHFAALPRIQPSFEDPLLHEQVNVIGTINIIKAVIDNKLKTKIIYSSSSSAYGNNYPSKVGDAIDPLSPYGLQKYTAERYLIQLGDRYNIPVVALRYFNVYGKRSYNPNNKFCAYSSVIGIFLDEKERGDPLDITGDGSQKRDFVHVLDVVRANWLAAKSNVKSGVFNIGTGKNISIYDLAKKISDNIIFIPERKGEAIETLAADIDITQKFLNWTPTVSLDRGIANYDTL